MVTDLADEFVINISKIKPRTKKRQCVRSAFFPFHLFFLAIAFVLWSGMSMAFGDTTVMTGSLLKAVRMDIVANGQTIGFATIPSGTTVIVTSVTDDGVLIRRSDEEAPFKIPKDSISVQMPVSATEKPTPSQPQDAVVTQARVTSSTETNSAVIPSAEQMNKALGIPLFGNGSLWEENDAMVAGHLGWPEESKTAYEAGYRRYPYTFNVGTKVLGARALSLFLQGINDKVSRVAILFANKGDVAFFSSAEEAKQQAAHPKQPLNVTDNMLRECHDAMQSDKNTIETALNSLLGPSRPARIGRFASMSEAGQRWDWKGHTFLLVAQPNEYVTLRILPTATFDDPDADKKSFQATKETISKRVEHRENGDVVITDLPMVNQGRKGYCVPATFERVLRYYGLSEDMNILAMAGQTRAGGGTSINAIEGATFNVIHDAGGIITQKNFSGSILEIKPFIDAGKPILFGHFSTLEFNKRVNERMQYRVAVSNWDDWQNKFLPSLKKSTPLQPDPLYSHVCLIIGYNQKTREIAISDSWGPAATERWMTEEEAQQIKQSGISVIE